MLHKVKYNAIFGTPDHHLNYDSMKFIFTSLILLSLTTVLFSQNKLDGIWVKYNDDDVEYYFIIKGNSIDHMVYSEDSDKAIKLADKNSAMDFNFIYQFQQNKNNGVYTWTNTCATRCAWTETHVYHLSYLSSNKIYYHWHRIVNNFEGEDCFESGGSCFTQEESGYLVKYQPKLTYGAASASNFVPTAYRLTSTYSELKVKLVCESSSAEYTLHPPGSSMAFYLRDKNGKTYALKGQDGFGGFTAVSGYAGEEIEFTLKFEKVPSYITTISLIEGDCSSGCWHIYDIKIP